MAQKRHKSPDGLWRPCGAQHKCDYADDPTVAHIEFTDEADFARQVEKLEKDEHLSSGGSEFGTVTKKKAPESSAASRTDPNTGLTQSRKTRPTTQAINSDVPVVMEEIGAGNDGVLWVVQPQDFDNTVHFLNNTSSRYRITPVTDMSIGDVHRIQDRLSDEQLEAVQQGQYEQAKLDFSSQSGAQHYIREQTGYKLDSLGQESRLAKRLVEERDGAYYVPNDPELINKEFHKVRVEDFNDGVLRQRSDKLNYTEYQELAAEQGKPVLSQIRQESVELPKPGHNYEYAFIGQDGAPVEIQQNTKKLYNNTQSFHRPDGTTANIQSTYMVVNTNAAGEPGRGNSFSVYENFKIIGNGGENENSTRIYRSVMGGSKQEQLQEAEAIARRAANNAEDSGSLGDHYYKTEFGSEYVTGHLAVKDGDDVSLERPITRFD